MKMERVMVQLPATVKAKLDTLRDEGYTAAAYIRHLVLEDMKVRKECGWVPGKGWVNWDKRPAAMAARENEKGVRRVR